MLNLKAICYYLQKDQNKSFKSFTNASQACHSITDKATKTWYQAILYNNASVLNWSSGLYPNSISYMQQSLKLIKINPYINENAEIIGVSLSLGGMVKHHLKQQKEIFSKFRSQNYLPILKIEDFRIDRAIKSNENEFSISEVYI